MSDADRYKDYTTLLRRNARQLVGYTLLLFVLVSGVGYLAATSQWLGFPAAFFTGIYTLYLLLRIDDMLGLSTVTYNAISGVSEKADKATVSQEIEAMLKSYEMGYHLPDDVTIIWEESLDEEPFLQNDREVICLDGSDHLHANACKSAFHFSRKYVVNHVRSYLTYPVNNGLDTFVSEDIITNARGETTYIDPDEARGKLFEELTAELDVDSWDKIDHVHSELDEVRDAGFFGPVLLHEYSKLSETGIPTSDIKNESRDFLKFLDRISGREPGDQGQLAYPGETINAGIGIIGGHHDIEYYEILAVKSFAKYDTTYILAEGDKISIAESLHERLAKKPGVAQSDEIKYSFREQSRFNEGYCLQYEVPSGRVSR